MSSIPIVEEDEFHPSLLSKASEVFISSQLNSFLFKEEFNNELEELIYQLIQYKKELEDSINEGRKINNSSIKNTLYLSLENMLIHASYITSDQLRHDYIHKLFNWYKEKSGNFIAISHRDITPSEVIKQNDGFLCNDDPEYKHRTKYASTTNLRQYRIKKVNKKRIEAVKGKIKEKQSEKQKDIFMLTKGSMKSTFYTSLQGVNCYATLEKLKRLNLQEILKENKLMTSAFNIPIQENKSSYSILRPPFKYDLLTIEKEIIKQKNKELKNKRTTEEIKSMVENYGHRRAQYKGAMNKKYEIKKMIEQNYYHSKENKFQNKTLSESLLLSNKNILIDQNETKHQVESSTINQKRKKKALNKTVQQEDSVFSLSKKQSVQNYLHKNKSRDLGKISLNNIQNKRGNTIIQKNSSAKEIDLKLRIKLYDSKRYIINTLKQDNDELPNDCISKELFYNHIFRTRNMNKSLIDLKEVSNYRDGYLGLNNHPLSFSDISNIDINNNQSNTIQREPSLNSIDYAKNTFKQLNNDFLLLRRTMANKRQSELTSLNKIRSKATKKLNKSALYQAYVNPLDENIYPATYLPHSGSGLLVTPYIS